MAGPSDKNNQMTYIQVISATIIWHAQSAKPKFGSTCITALCGAVVPLSQIKNYRQHAVDAKPLCAACAAVILDDFDAPTTT